MKVRITVDISDEDRHAIAWYRIGKATREEVRDFAAYALRKRLDTLCEEYQAKKTNDDNL